MVQVKILTPSVESQWEAYVQASPQATFFHQLGWKRVLEDCYGYIPHYLYAEDRGGIKGVLPLFEIRTLLLKRALVSVPFGVYGGICSTTEEAALKLAEQAKILADELSVDYLELRHSQKSVVPWPASSLYVDFRGPLSKDPAENFEQIPRKQRRMIRQGIKNGLRTTMEDGHLKRFYEIYSHSVRNLGTPVFSRRFLERIVQEFKEQCRILSVWHEREMVGGVLAFFFKDEVLPYYGGALKRYFSMAVNDIMYWDLMRYGCEHGFRVFVFGRSRVNSGPYHFKRHWGFEPAPLCYQYYSQGGQIPQLNPENPKFRHLIWLWKKLPVPVTQVLGPQIVRWLP